MGNVKCTRKVQYIYTQTHLNVQTQRMTGDTRLFHDAVDNCLNETNGGNLYGKRTNSRSEDRRSADTPELGAGDHRLSAAPSEFDRLDGSQPAREPHRGGGEDRRRLPAADRPFHGERQDRVEQAGHPAAAEGSRGVPDI